jgi:hypothetical protein
MTEIAGLDRRKLALVLGRLGSSFDGERAEAARVANEMVRRAGLTWPQLANPVPALPAPLQWREAVEQCLAASDVISDWEADFLISLRRFRKLSPKQFETLNRIVAKIERVG